MPFLDRLKGALSAAWHWLRTAPHLTAFSVVVCCSVVLVKLADGLHEKFERWEAAWEGGFKPIWLAWYEFLYLYVELIAGLGFLVFLVYAIRCWPDLKKLVRPVFLLGLYFFLWFLATELRDEWWILNYGMLGEPQSTTFFIGKLVMLAILCLTPPFILAWYAGQPMLQRYTLRAFLQPLLFCYATFVVLVVMIDLMDNLRDFQEARIPRGVLLGFYLDLMPYVFVMVTPAALLLATLYSLTKLSRANEIVSMLTSGLSLPQVLKPILIVAGYLSLIGMAMNYHWAPRAEGKRAAVLRELSEKKSGATMATAVMHRNEKTGRTWFIGKVPFDTLNNKMQTIEVRQTDGHGRIKTSWRSKTAKWWAPVPGGDSPHGMWSFYHGTERSFKAGVANEEKFFDGTVPNITRIDMVGWPETPYSIISAALLPDNLGVPELVSYERANETLESTKLAPFRTHFHHRFAYPWQGFVVALMAAPLGVAFSRRGALGGIAASVIIFFALMFVNEFFMGLGKGNHIAPWLAAWTPHLIIGTIGIILFRARALNQDLPKLSPIAWWKQFRTWQQRRQGPAPRPARAH